MLSCLFIQHCGHLLGTANLLALVYVIFLVFLSLSHLVSSVRCGTRLYRFLIFGFFLTLSVVCDCDINWSYSLAFNLSLVCDWGIFLIIFSCFSTAFALQSINEVLSILTMVLRRHLMEQNLSQSFPFLYRSLLDVCSTYMVIFLSVSQEIRLLE